MRAKHWPGLVWIAIKPNPKFWAEMSKGSSNASRVSKIQIIAFVEVKSLLRSTAETRQKETWSVCDRCSLVALEATYTKDFHLEHMNNNTRQYVTASYGKIINRTQNVPPSQTSLWFWRTNRTRTWAVGAVSIFHTTMIWSVRNVTQTIAWPNLGGSSSEVGVQFSKVYSSISCNTSATCASPGKKTRRHTWKHRRKGVRGIFHRGSGLPPQQAEKTVARGEGVRGG